jgi:hypothetical protein
LEAEVKALEVRRQEEAYLPRIQSISLTSNLAALRATRDELRGFAISLPEIVNARDAAVAKLEVSIRELEQFARDLPARCDQVTSRLAVDKLRDEIMHRQTRFVGSSHEQLLGDSLERVNTLLNFFSDLDNLKRIQIHSPLDVTRAQRSHEVMVNQYGARLSPPQLALLDDALHKVDDDVARMQDGARKWLQQRTEEARSGSDPVKLAQTLEKLPPFFPDELQPPLQQLKAEVQRRIDEDALLQVEQAFRKLTNRAKQEECLRRLAALLHTDAPASVR